MNKHALKMKKQRRAERQKKHQEVVDKIVQDFNDYQRSVGKSTNLPPELIYRTYKRKEAEFIADATITTVVVTIYVLSEIYHFGFKRLYKYISRLFYLVDAVYDGTRTIQQLRNEILYETKIDCMLIPPFPDTVDVAKIVLLDHCQGIMVLCLYQMYFDLRWKNKRLQRLFNDVCAELQDVILNNRLSEIKKHLSNKFDIKFTAEGRIKMPKLKGA